MFAGDAASGRAAKRALLNTGARTYMRKRETWVCGSTECLAHAKAAGKKAGGSGMSLSGLGILGVLAIAALSNGGEDERPTATPERAAVAIQAPAPSRAPVPASSAFGENAGVTAPTVDPGEARAVQHMLEMAQIETEFRGADLASRQRLQEALQQKGYYQGNIDGDGAWGPGTALAFERAIRTLRADGQREYNLATAEDVHAAFYALLGF